MRKAKKATPRRTAAARRKTTRKKTTRKAARKATKRVRCAATTKDKKRCKRFTDGKSKYCSVHKTRR